MSMSTLGLGTPIPCMPIPLILVDGPISFSSRRQAFEKILLVCVFHRMLSVIVTPEYWQFLQVYMQNKAFHPFSHKLYATPYRLEPRFLFYIRGTQCIYVHLEFATTSGPLINDS